MEQLFITNLEIKKVRHLKDISISLSDKQVKHLIFTGKNGSGKTSVVEAMAYHLNNVLVDKFFLFKENSLKDVQSRMEEAVQTQYNETQIVELENELCKRKKEFEHSRKGLHINFNQTTSDIYTLKINFII